MRLGGCDLRYNASVWCKGLFAVTLLSCGCAGAGKTSAPEPDTGRDEGEPSTGNPRSDLIPRAILFGHPERVGVLVSPDGKWISWHAPHNGVLNVWVTPANDLEKARPLTGSTKQPIYDAEWTFDGKHLVYLQDDHGDENFHIFRVAVETGAVVDLTPIENVRAEVVALSHRKPNTMVVALNERDKAVFDLHAIDITTGERRLVVRNDQELVGLIVDHDLKPRFAQRLADDGTLLWMVRHGNGWRHYDETRAEDVSNTIMFGIDASGESYYIFDSRGRDTSALFAVDIKTKKRRLVYADERADLGAENHPWPPLVHPTEKTIQAVVVDYDKPRWVVLDPRLDADFEALAELDGGVPTVTSRTLDDATWIVAFESDAKSTRYYRWDRRARKGELLFAERPALDRHPLVPMHPVTIESRDGLPLVSYLSLPKHADHEGDGKPDRRVPMVLLVHGGPWARDRWGFDPLHQLFANRGYAVLSVNFRGSTGFGKAFVNAGNRQLGKKMHDDLLDAVSWAVEHGVTQKDEVCIVGGSFGGYAALVGLTLTPDVFACGVDIVGPSNLLTFFETIPPYWQTEMTVFHQRIGDPSTPEGRQALLDVSPLTHAARITKPLLVAQGANDPRVKKSESDQIVAAMQAKDIPVSYVVFPDEGHGFNHPENAQAFLAVAEAFLSAHIGGWYQPLDAAEIAASSMVVEAGRQWLPGLGEPESPRARRSSQ